MAINDPRDIPGLLAWYSAEAETGYADGAVMTGWTDLSGNGNHATINSAGPLWQATTGSAGGPAVRFDGTRAFNLPNMLTGAVAGEVLAIVKSDGGTSALWTLGSDTAAGDEQAYPYTGTTVYENFGRPASSRLSWNANGITLWHRYDVYSAANDWAARWNGGLKASTTTNTVTWTSSLRLGRGRKSGADDQFFKGYVAGFVLYGRQLTTTERSDLDAWATANPSGGMAGSGAQSITLSGTAPAVVGAFDVTVPQPPPEVTFTGSAPAVTGSFGASVAVPPAAANLAGNAPKVTGSFSLAQSGVTIADLAGTAPVVSGSFGATVSSAPVEVVTDSVNRLNGMTLVTEWHVEITEPVSIPTRQPAHDYAVATSLPEPTLVEGRPT